jgi:hypothetical protein
MLDVTSGSHNIVEESLYDATMDSTCRGDWLMRDSELCERKRLWSVCCCIYMKTRCKDVTLEIVSVSCHAKTVTGPSASKQRSICCWQILLKIDVCGINRHTFQFKLLKMFKISANYEHFTNRRFTSHVNICVPLQTNVYLSMSSTFWGSYHCVVNRCLCHGGSLSTYCICLFETTLRMAM